MQGIEQLHETTKAIAQLGRFEDDYLAHVAKGEMVVPGDVLKNNPEIKKAIFKELKKLGVKSPSTYIVGSKFMRINPMTGQPEFFLKQIFKAAKDIFKSPVGGAIVGGLIPQLQGISGFGGMMDIFNTKAGRGLTSAGIAALLGANPQQALASGALGALTGQGQMFPTMGETEAKGGGIIDLITGIFRKPKVPTLGEYAKETLEMMNLDPDSEDGKSFLIEQFPSIQNSYQEKYGNQESLFQKSLPYLTLAGGLYAMNKAREDRPEYNIQDNPFLYAQGGGVGAFAMGGTPEFPRLTDDVKGPGDGQSDSIPAMLSKDEHILTKREVETIGRMAGGDVDTGHEILKNVRTEIDDIGAQMGVNKA